MRAAMAEAEVGDDVLSEDPTINRLQERLAEMLGKEAALFVPSGTMSNQIGLRVHCRQGDEILCESSCHIYGYEQGGFAQLIGAVARPVDGHEGELRLDQLRQLIRPDNCHYVRTRLVCLENTHNRGGGRVLPYDGVVQICNWAHEHGLATHMDGARLFNAVVASGMSAAKWAEPFDTVSVCFSKGLGAPVGSALAGPRKLIAEGVRHRKLLGGGMRQAGIIAAAALYALEHHVERLAEDHDNCKRLADAIRKTEGLELKPDRVETNILFFRVSPRLGTGQEFAARLKQRGMLVGTEPSGTIRAVTHLDLSDDDIEQAAEILRDVAAEAGNGQPVAVAKSAYA
jgi:threonine aldolase